MSECDGHNYVYDEGGFYCTKCGHIREFRKRQASKPVILVLLFLAVIGAFLIPYNLDLNMTDRQASRAIGDTESNVSGMIGDSGLLPIRTDSLDPMLVEDHIYKLTNAERVSRDLESLYRVSDIDSIARGHSEDMYRQDYFAHDSPEGHDPSDRAEKAGYECWKYYQGRPYLAGLGENLSQSVTYASHGENWAKTPYSWYDSEEDLARAMVDGWMNSTTGHRENILNPGYDRIGVGVFIGEDDDSYHTQNFC